MSQSDAVIEGTLKPDGTLELDQKPNLPAGRVTVLLRQCVNVVPPADEPFWRRMQAMWAIPTELNEAGNGGADTLSEVRIMRDGWEERQHSIEALQEASKPK